MPGLLEEIGVLSSGRALAGPYLDMLLADSHQYISNKGKRYEWLSILEEADLISSPVYNIRSRGT